MTKEMYKCEYCGRELDWNGEGNNGNELLICEEGGCTKIFCVECFIKKHGIGDYQRMITSDTVMCPNCYEAYKKNKKIFQIPVTWEVYDTVEIEADSLEEAIRIFDRDIDDIPLPTEPEYVDSSFRRESEYEFIEALNQ